MTTGYTFADPDAYDFSAESGTVTVTPVDAPLRLTVHASENSSTGYFPVAAALDGSTSTAWETGTVTAQATSLTVRRTDSAAFTVTDYTLAARDGWTGRAPATFSLLASNDATSWLELDTRTGVTTWDDGLGPKTFTLASPATYKYWKLVVTQTQNPGDIVNLGELYFNGIQNTPPTPGKYYVRMTGVPRGRLVELTLTGDLLQANWQYVWRAHVPEYAENQSETVGGRYWNPNAGAYSGEPTLYGIGRDLILAVGLNNISTFTISWTSEQGPAYPQPVTWYDRQVIEPPSGSVTYDGINTPGRGSQRFYSLTSTTTDLITISTNEPNGYYEVYAETGVEAWDSWVEDGQNDAGGVPRSNDILSFVPMAGQEYVVVVYPNQSPDAITEYTLTWEQETLPPPPYIVGNDAFLNAINLGAVTNGMTHGYDNTGATTDSDVATWGKRSIWYRFHSDTPVAVKVTATASTSDTELQPDLDLFRMDKFYEAGSSNGVLYRKLETPALEYYLCVSFPNSGPRSPWEQHGTLSFEVKAIPQHQGPDPYALPPGNADPGGGQNYYVGPLFEGSAFGADGKLRIVAPTDGGLSLILEAGQDSNGDTWQPSAKVTLPGYYAETYWYGSGPLTMDTEHTDAKSPRKMPWRPVGATTPEPVTISVKAGDVVDITISFALSGCYVRWGMTNQHNTPSGWLSGRYGDVVTSDGTVVPSGWSAELAADMRANASAWPSDLSVGNPEAMRYHLYSASREINNASDYEITTGNMGVARMDAVNGVGGSHEPTDYPYGPYAGINGRVMYEPALSFTIQHVDAGIRLFHDKAQVWGNDVVQAQTNGQPAESPSSWSARSAADVRCRELLDAHKPLIYRAQRGELLSTSPWYGSTPTSTQLDNHDTALRLLQWHIEWEGVTGAPKPVYNEYRWMPWVSVRRYTTAPYDAANGIPASAVPIPMTVNLYDAPTSLVGTPWLNPASVVTGELVESTSFVAGPTDDGISDGHDVPYYGPHPYDRDLVTSDVFGGTQPQTGAVGYDRAYVALTDVYVNGVDWSAMMANHWSVRGMTSPYWFPASAFFTLEAELSVVTRLARTYPSQVRVSTWVPSLEPLNAAPPGGDPDVHVLPGSTIKPDPNLTGKGDGVEVHFATS